MNDFHHFSTKLACDLGINTAVIYANISFWIKKNKEAGKEKHFHNNQWWTYNSVAKFHEEQFEYISERTIKNCLKKLIDHKYLIKGNFNDKTYDKTNWYSFGEKGIQFEKSIGQYLPNGQDKDTKSIGQDLPNSQGSNCPSDNTQFAQPIPDINSTDINTDIVDEVSSVSEILNFYSEHKKENFVNLNYISEHETGQIKKLIDKYSVQKIKEAITAASESEYYQTFDQVKFSNIFKEENFVKLFRGEFKNANTDKAKRPAKGNELKTEYRTDY